VCAPEIRRARGEEIGLAVQLHLLDDGGVEFGTATLPHGAGDRLADSYSTAAKAWESMVKDGTLRKFRKAHGYWGFVRTVEVTYGFANGWHPHLHWLDFWDGVLSAEDRAEYRSLCFGAWSRGVVRQGMGMPSESRGLVVLPVRDGEVADYVTKLAPMSAAHELTSLSTKRAKLSGLTPFDILRKVTDVGGMPWTGLLWEYESATRGRRMLGASHHLLKRLGLSADDPEPDESGVVVALIGSEDWGRLRWSHGGLYGVQGVIEAAAEAGGSLGVREAMRVLLGGLPELVAGGPVVEQLELGPIEERDDF
jgi:hypothetical protein